MNRIIKFRYWDNEENRMKTDKHQYDEDIVWMLFSEKRFVPMQFTGLFDKNSKEVFQGDILKVQSAKEDYGSCSYGGFLKVVALTCGYTLEPFNPTLKEIEDKGEFWDSSSLWHIRESKYIEVIGNVFENPNLLKK